MYFQIVQQTTDFAAYSQLCLCQMFINDSVGYVCAGGVERSPYLPGVVVNYIISSELLES